MKDHLWQQLVSLFIRNKNIGILKKDGSAVFFNKKYFKMSFDPLSGKTFKGTIEEVFVADIDKVSSAKSMRRFILKRESKLIENNNVA